MKKISLFIVSMVLSFICINKIYASNATINVTTNKSTVIVADTVVITVKVSSSSNLGSWNFDVVPSSNLTFVSSSFGGLFVADQSPTTATKSKTYTFTFRAKSSGTGTVKVSNSRVIDFDSEENMKISTNSVSFKIMTQSELEATYSKNNYLANLEVEGYTLTPQFDKDVLEYNLDLEYGTESINIIADLEDRRSSIDGDGQITLSQGMNSIKVVVTAENGSTRIYVINANVKELDPINIIVNGNNFSVVREEQFLPSVNSAYQPTTIQIDDKDVPAYYNSATDFTLVGLKDEVGNIQLYIYKDGIYTLYNELNFNQLAVYLLDMDESLLPNGYNKKDIIIGDKIIKGYVKDGYEFAIIYGLNIETGEKHLYKYDAKENTLQRVENIDSGKESLYFNIILGSFGFTAVSYIIFINLLSKKNKEQKNFLDKTTRLNISQIVTNEDLSDKLYKAEAISKKEQKKKQKEEKKLQKKLKKC